MHSLTLQTSDNIIGSGDVIGKLQFAASAETDATGRLLSASLYAQAESAFTSAGNATSLVFSTSNNDTNPTTARLKVAPNGDFLPVVDNSYDIGSSSLRFQNAYFSEGITLSSNTPSVTTNKLYNSGGSLYFNGSVVGGGGGGTTYTAGSGITIDNNDKIHVFGGSGHFVDLNIESSLASNIPLTIKGFTNQSANLQEWQDSSSNVLTSVSSNGVIEARGYKTNSNMIITESNSSRTLSASDNGKIIRCTNSTGTTITVPSGLELGFSSTFIQSASGAITFNASSGGSIRNRLNHAKTGGQYAVASLIKVTSNEFYLAGDTGV